MEALKNVRFISHGCVCFESEGNVVYVDPFRLPKGAPAASLIIVTHTHSDHYSPKHIKSILAPGTRFAATAEAAEKLQKDLDVDASRITVLAARDAGASFPGIAEVTPVPAVNKNHPVGFGFGVVLAFGGYVYYLSGDTDTLAPDIACDVLFCVCDGIWNMPHYAKIVPEQLAAMRVQPKLTVPYHYGSYAPGTGKNGKKLCEALTNAGLACREMEIL